jgi:hypothetical protein
VIKAAPPKPLPPKSTKGAKTPLLAIFAPFGDYKRIKPL